MLVPTPLSVSIGLRAVLGHPECSSGGFRVQSGLRTSGTNRLGLVFTLALTSPGRHSFPDFAEREAASELMHLGRTAS